MEFETKYSLRLVLESVWDLLEKSPKLLLINLLLFSQHALSIVQTNSDPVVPKHWYTLPENLPANQQPEALQNLSDEYFPDPDKKTIKEVDNTFIGIKESLDYMHSHSKVNLLSSRSNWLLEHIMLDFALTSMGKIGILGADGRSAVNTTWYPTKKSLSSEPNKDYEDAADYTIPFNPSTEQLNQTAEFLIKQTPIKKKKSLRKNLDKVLKKFNQFVLQLNSDPSLPWQIHKFRLTIIIDLLGKVHTNINAGGRFMFRLDWLYLPNRLNSLASKDSPLNQLLQDVSYLEKHPRAPKASFKAKYILFMLGVGAGGNIGVANAAGLVVGGLTLKRNPNYSRLVPIDDSRPSLPLILPQLNQQQESFVDKHNIPIIKQTPSPSNLSSAAHWTKINRKNFRKGMIRSYKIAEFFMDRAKRHKGKHFQMRKIRTDMEMSLSGGVHLVTLRGFAGLRIFWERKT